MKSFKNYVILSLGLIIALLIVMANGVQATSPTLIFGNNTTANTTTTNGVGDATTGVNGVTTNTSTLNTATGNASVANVTPTKDPATVNVTNTSKNNTTNTTKGSGNLPQTGENDIYIVSGIGLVALAIGGVAYMKSRKYDM